jgi:hypothetical protein
MGFSRYILGALLFAQWWRNNRSEKCYSTIFGFGDSKTDTGQMQTAFPFQSPAEFWPYGKTFFGRPVNRYCDGRLVIDFMSEH